MNTFKDFGKKTLSQLSRKGISIVGTQAIPGFDGDRYFSGVAYKLVFEGTGFLRTYREVVVLAASSWDPKTYFTEQVNA